MLGNDSLARERGSTQAIEYFKRALALKPDYDLAVFNMANVYRQIGQGREALVGYRRLLELDPKNAQTRYEVAQILIDRGRLGEEARSSPNPRSRSSRRWRRRETRSGSSQ